MAYDLLFRRQTSRNWSRRSYLGPAARGTLLLASYEFAPDPTPTTPEEQGLIAKLAVLKMQVDAGDKKALVKWRKISTYIAKAKMKAAKGDAKAKRFITVLNESGLFAGVQSMSV